MVIETSWEELSLREMLADPIVHAVMARDGVTEREVKELIGALGERMAGRQIDAAGSAALS